MLGLLRYVDGDLGDPATYEAMSNEMGQAQEALFYLEVPPPLFGRIAEGISKAGRAAGNRVMVEKPFGNDLASAQQLNATMQAYFPEDAIYRVDHWLGLDPVDSLMFVRFANSIIEPLLNRDHVQCIQITMAEAFDVADRGSFYDKTGAIRDVIQNHMLQVLATVLAEPPDGTGLDSWRAAKSQVIGALRPLTPELTVKGQYDGYLQVAGVDPKSVTETFVAIRLAADSWRWADVPILIRAGKCLPVTATEVVITFRRPPHDAFALGDQAPANRLRFRINPRRPGQPLPGLASSVSRAGSALRRASYTERTPLLPVGQADDEVLFGGQHLAAEFGGSGGHRGRPVVARPEVGEHQPAGTGSLGPVAGLSGSHQVAYGPPVLAVPVGRLDDEQVGVTPEFCQQRVRPGIPGEGQGDSAGLHADARIGHEVRERQPGQVERPYSAGAGQGMQVEDRGQVGIGLQALESIEHARWTVQRQPWPAGAAIQAHPEQPVQIDAVIRVLVADGNSVDGTVWPMRKQPGERSVAEVQYQAVSVPVHRKPAARTPRLRERAATAEHRDLPHPSSMPARVHRIASRDGGVAASCRGPPDQYARFRLLQAPPLRVSGLSR